MNLKFFLFLLFIVAAPSVFAQQARFDEATSLLEQQNFREAIDLYKSIAQEGHHSGALWLNMGVAYARLDSMGMAKFYLLQAEEYEETKMLAQKGLIFVNERLSRRSAVLPPLPWERFFRFLISSVGITPMFILSFLMLYLGVTSIILSWFFSQNRKHYYVGGLSAIGFSVIIFACSFYMNYIENRYGTGVLTDRQSVVYEEPNRNSAPVSTAYEGYTMRVDFKESTEHSGWNYIRLENGMYGWVESDALSIF